MYYYVGGRQFKITPNDLIVINRIPADIGEKIILEKVQSSFATPTHSLWLGFTGSLGWI